MKERKAHTRAQTHTDHSTRAQRKVFRATKALATEIALLWLQNGKAAAVLLGLRGNCLKRQSGTATSEGNEAAKMVGPVSHWSMVQPIADVVLSDLPVSCTHSYVAFADATSEFWLWPISFRERDPQGHKHCS